MEAPCWCPEWGRGRARGEGVLVGEMGGGRGPGEGVLASGDRGM